jgi:hypothetical protein
LWSFPLLPSSSKKVASPSQKKMWIESNQRKPKKRKKIIKKKCRNHHLNLSVPTCPLSDIQAKSLHHASLKKNKEKNGEKKTTVQKKDKKEHPIPALTC